MRGLLDRAPHPPLRGTFSLEGRRKKAKAKR
jgi:hypothetical protein